MNSSDSNIFGQVLYIGPSTKGHGGISTMMKQYSQVIAPFHFLPVNSPRGKVAGYLNVLGTALRLPFYRLKGCRIAHIHYASGNSWYRETALARLSKLFGFKVVMHCHCNLPKLAEKHNKAAVQSVLGKVDANVVLAKSYQEFASEELHLDDITIVPNFILETEGSANTVPKNSKLTTFLFMGLLTKAKGFYDLLKAVADVAENTRDVRLIVCGSGDMVATKKAVESFGINDLVEFRGWVTGAKKTQTLGEADVIVLPSYTEAMPMSIIEAFYNGKPVIGSTVGAIPDMISDGIDGICIKPGDTKALSAAMLRFINDSQLLSSAKAAARQKYKDYTPGKALSILTNIYGKILNK